MAEEKKKTTAKAKAADKETPAKEKAPAKKAPAKAKSASKEKAPAKETPAKEKAPGSENKPKETAKKESPKADATAPVVRAEAKYVRSSARKARLVCDHIRGKSVSEARAILAHAPRAVAQDWSKLLESAVANAEHNDELDGEDLTIKAVYANEGPTLKRFRPRAQGRATPIHKRTSHLTILLTPKN